MQVTINNHAGDKLVPRQQSFEIMAASINA